MSEEKKSEGLVLFNNGKRSYTYAESIKKDAKGIKVVERGHIGPGEKKAVPEAEAKKLLKMYPMDISTLEKVAMVDTSKKALDAEKESHEKTFKELEEAKKEIAALKEELLKARAEVNTLKEALKEKEKENKTQGSGRGRSRG